MWPRKIQAPLLIGWVLAVVLFGLVPFQILNGLSINADNPYIGYDYFGLPRCGLAILHGTNPFTAAQDYSFGPWATDWVSHPMMCATFGVTLSLLPPMFGMWAMNALYLLLNLWVMWVFGKRIQGIQRSDWVFFAALGLFFPWYPLYYFAQFHAIAVLAVALALVSPRTTVAGCVISAFSKPVLAPAGLVFLFRRSWRKFFWIVLLVTLGSLPWVTDPHFREFFTRASDYARWSVYRWNQQISLSAALDEWMTTYQHYWIRLVLALAAVFTGAILLRKEALEKALAVSLLWFFFLYARGFEYQLTLYVPILLYFYTEPGGRYRNWPLTIIALLLALPTTYPMFTWLYGDGHPWDYPNGKMLELNPALYYAFLWHKPLAAFLLFGLILIKERSHFVWPWPIRPGLTGAVRDL